MNKVTNITFVGVGGQGILLTSEILARAAALSGLSVKKSEIHGMSQRGGSVSSQVRFGEAVYSPIIPDGESDVLVSFEKLEAIRCFNLLRPDGRAIVDMRDIIPLTVSSGFQVGLENRDEVIAKLYGPRVKLVNSTMIAQEIGNARSANMVIAGALSKLMPFGIEVWHEAMRSRIKASLLDMNIRAFDAGRNA